MILYHHGEVICFLHRSNAAHVIGFAMLICSEFHMIRPVVLYQYIIIKVRQ